MLLWHGAPRSIGATLAQTAQRGPRRIISVGCLPSASASAGALLSTGAVASPHARISAFRVFPAALTVRGASPIAAAPYAGSTPTGAAMRAPQRGYAGLGGPTHTSVRAPRLLVDAHSRGNAVWLHNGASTAIARTTASTSSSSSSPKPAAAASGEPAAPAVHDGMPRYPNLTAGGSLRAMDYFGTVVFALSGSVTAASVGMDWFGAMTLGTITAVGGGTIRDAILLRKRPFWADGETEYLFLSFAAALVAFFLYPSAERAGYREDGLEMLWGDAVGVGAFCVIGAQNGIRAGVHPLVCVVCGVVTATFGGMTRDALAQRPVRILHSHSDVYATTAGAGATAYMLARAAGLPLGVRIVAGVGSAVVLRYLAWTRGIRLSTWEKLGEGHLVAPSKRTLVPEPAAGQGKQ